MAVLQMQRMNLVAMKQSRKAILERLQELGVLEIDVNLEESEGIVLEDTSGQKTEFEKQASLADQAIEILDRYAPEKKSLLASLAGKPLVGRDLYEDVVRNCGSYLETAEKIVRREKEISEAKAGILKLENQQEMLEPWKKLDVAMNTCGTEHTVLFLGTIGEAVTAQTVLATLKCWESPVEAADVQILESGKDGTWLTVICLNEDASAAEDALRSIGFARPSYLVDDIPVQAQKQMSIQIDALEEDIQKYSADIVAQGDSRQKLQLVSDYCRLRAEKYETLGTLPQTANTFAVSGFIPQYRAEEVARELTDHFGAAVELEKIDEKEEAPVLLKNNKFSDSVEGILSSYGLPGKGEIDPTFFMSVFYVFLFGMMLSDAAYGAIIVIGCAAALLKFPRMEDGLKKTLKLFLWCGVSTVFWGIMFGSYFGDLINVVSRNWMGHEVSIPAVWFAPLEDPMRLLIYSLLFGVIHMFIGLGLKGFMMLKGRDVVGFISDVLSWFLLLIGLILILLPSSIFESISGMTFVFPDVLNKASIVMAVAGAVIILVMSGRRKKKNIGMRLAIGLYDLYGITSWLSDLLSYSRLLALGLATGVIAQVINQMGSMFGTGILGTVIFVVVFLVGTVLNLAINLLGAYVHSNRLEFVEFFNKFYDGGGKPFQPFKAVTKYVEFAKSR